LTWAEKLKDHLLKINSEWHIEIINDFQLKIEITQYSCQEFNIRDLKHFNPRIAIFNDSWYLTSDNKHE